MLHLLFAITVPLFSASPGEWNVVDFGAAPDAQTDNTSAFQRALDAAAAAGGGVVRVPAGHYRLSGVLSIPGAVTLRGTFEAPPTDQREGWPKLDGSVLMAYAGRGATAGPPFITLAGSMAALAGFTVTYPEWNEADVPPVPYPPTVAASGVVNTAILDCLFLNSYEAVHFQDSGRFLVRNVYGYPSFRGLYTDNCLDIGRAENCHFWPFGITHGASAYTKWINENGVAFEFARSDWQYVTNTFCFGYGVGYKFSTTKNGSCNGNFLGIGADSCRRGVVVDTIPECLDLLITNGEFVGRWGTVDSVGVEIIGQSTGRVSLNNCAFWGPLDRAVWSRAPKADLAVTACGFRNWDLGAQDSPAIQIDGGKAVLQGNSFAMEGIDVRVGELVSSAILVANQASVGFRVENHAGPRTQMTSNEADLLEWPRGARRHYRIQFGADGDGRYVRGFHSKELARPWKDGGTMRWGGQNPRLILPVDPRVEYTAVIEVCVPAQAIDPRNGVYLGDRRIAELPEEEGACVVTVTIPRQKEDRVELTLRGKAWRAELGPQAPEGGRPLTVGVRTVTMAAKNAPKEVFDANNGGLVSTPPEAGKAAETPSEERLMIDASFFENCAFVSVDIQEGTKPGPISPDQVPPLWKKMGFTADDVNAANNFAWDVAFPNALKVADTCRDLGLPMIFIHWGYLFEDGMDLDPDVRKVMLDDNGTDYSKWSGYYAQPESQPAKAFNIRKGDYVLGKAAQDAFRSCNIEFVLRNLGIKHIVFVGGHTGACLGKTARSAKQHGYTTLCIKDATNNARESSRESDILATGYDYILTTAEFIELAKSVKK